MYKKSANFDTYYLINMKFYIDVFLQGALLTEHLYKLEIQKQQWREQLDKKWEEQKLIEQSKIEILKSENRSIVQLNNNLKLIRTFTNNLEVLAYLKQSDSFLFNIEAACKGLQKKCMNYKWMYEEDYNKMLSNI
jgi:hypothetical protein